MPPRAIELPQILLIASTVLLSWLGMQIVHEAGHVAGAWLSGGSVCRVVLHPLEFSRTDLSHNPSPLLVAWSGPAVGVLLPVVLFALARVAHLPGWYIARFFAGFCLIANGAYIGAGSFDRAGDAGDLVHHGAPIWTLWLFGLLTAPLGLLLWHGLGRYFGLKPSAGRVSLLAAWSSFAAVVTVIAAELLYSRLTG